MLKNKLQKSLTAAILVFESMSSVRNLVPEGLDLVTDYYLGCLNSPHDFLVLVSVPSKHFSCFWFFGPI